MKHFRHLSIFAAGALLAAACPAQNSGLSDSIAADDSSRKPDAAKAAQNFGLLDGIAATVNNSVITVLQVQDQIISELKELQTEYPNDPTNFYAKAAMIQKNQLDLMERSKLILEDFARGEYTTNWVDEEVEAAIKQETQRAFGGSHNKLLMSLQAAGKTFEDYKRQTREMVIVQNLARVHTGSGKIVISPAAIEKFYNDHQDAYKVEDQIKLRVIQIPDPPGSAPGAAKQLAAEILQKIDSGVPFAEMAMVNSSDSERASGGDWGWVDRKRLINPLADVAFSLKAGQHSQVVEVPGENNGSPICYLLMVDEVRPAHVRPLSEIEGDIERTLQLQRSKVVEDQWIQRLQAKSRIFTY
jgi:parvulin-like peptidyl-prolyl isomerase